MSTEFFNDQWRIPSNENQNKVSNYSMDFDGVSDKIEFGDVNGFERTDSFSFSLWVNISSYATYYYISKQLATAPFTGFILFSTSTGQLQFLLNNTFSSNTLRVNSSSQIPLNQWVHLTLTYDGSSSASGVNMYFNGVSQTIITVNNNLTATTLNTTEFQISGRDGGNGNLVGKIDQVSIFNYALPATGTNSVATLYGGGTAITNPMTLSPAPVAYYQLGDQSVDNGANLLVPNNSLSDFVFDFDGTDDFIDLGQDVLFNSTQGFSVSAWVNLDSYSTKFPTVIRVKTDQSTDFIPIALSNQAGYTGVIFGSSSNFLTGRTTGDISGDFLNTWKHVCFTFDGVDRTAFSSYKVYVDGSSVVLVNAGVFGTFTSKNNLIGYSQTNDNYCDGKISNVSIFSTELTSPQVEIIYNNGAPNDISSLSPVGWYKLNAADTFNSSTSTWTINDYGSGSNDGTSSGMDSSNLIVSDLQHTSGFSPYALDFSGITANLKTNTIPAQTNTVTLSVWVKRTGATGTSAGVFGVRNSGGPMGTFGVCWDLAFLTTTNKIEFRIADTTYRTVAQNTAMPDNTWTHVVGVADGTNIKLYINGVLQTDTDTYSSNLLTPSTNIRFAAQGPSGSNPFNGQLSNCARWNVGLTQAEVTEIYNQGVPSNLNTFSGNAPIGWWQLGSNSSFEGNDWTCLDEIGTDNADSGATAMSNDDIVNGVGYSANGLGTSSIEIANNAPYSTNNGLSENMDVLDRSTDVAPT